MYRALSVKLNKRCREINFPKNIDHGFEPRSGKTKNCKMGICCFSAKHSVLMRKRKDWYARNQDNVSEWGDMYIRGLDVLVIL
jgi:hypothetical protein